MKAQIESKVKRNIKIYFFLKDNGKNSGVSLFLYLRYSSPKKIKFTILVPASHGSKTIAIFGPKTKKK